MTISPLLFIAAVAFSIVGGLWLGLELCEAADVKEAWQEGYATGYEDGNGDRLNRLQVGMRAGRNDW